MPNTASIFAPASLSPFSRYCSPSLPLCGYKWDSTQKPSIRTAARLGFELVCSRLLLVSKYDASRVPKDCEKYVKPRHARIAAWGGEATLELFDLTYENGVSLSWSGFTIRGDGQDPVSKIRGGTSNIRRSRPRARVFGHPTLLGRSSGGAPAN